MKKTLLLTVAFCLLATQTKADINGYYFKPYLGLDYVHSWLGSNTIGNNAYGEDLKLKKDNMSAGSVSVGMKFHPNFAVEAFYTQSDKIDSDINVQLIDRDEGYWNEDKKFELKYKAMGIDIIGSIPVFNSFEFLGSLGGGYYKVTGKTETTSYYGLPIYINQGSESSKEWGIRIGVGAQYYLTNYLALRCMARISRIDSIGSITDLTAGVRVYF